MAAYKVLVKTHDSARVDMTIKQIVKMNAEELLQAVIDAGAGDFATIATEDESFAECRDACLVSVQSILDMKFQPPNKHHFDAVIPWIEDEGYHEYGIQALCLLATWDFVIEWFEKNTEDIIGFRANGRDLD